MSIGFENGGKYPFWLFCGISALQLDFNRSIVNLTPAML
jgi:hypothetical protein